MLKIKHTMYVIFSRMCESAYFVLWEATAGIFNVNTLHLKLSEEGTADRVPVLHSSSFRAITPERVTASSWVGGCDYFQKSTHTFVPTSSENWWGILGCYNSFLKAARFGINKVLMIDVDVACTIVRCTDLYTRGAIYDAQGRSHGHDNCRHTMMEVKMLSRFSTKSAYKILYKF